jgi:DMSO/TMAO reductase YedYZ heme-binding membrane subunit
MTTTVVGGIGYVLIAAMTATSFDRSAAWLGPRRWRRLHTIGAYYVWLVFFLSFAPRALSSPLYLPFALAVVAAPVLRWRAGHGVVASATADGLRSRG